MYRIAASLFLLATAARAEFREIRLRNASADSADPLVAEGALNGGGPVLRILTSNGIIFLRRQK